MGLFLLLIVALGPSAQAPNSRPVLPADATTRAAWLLGCWQSTGAAITTRESWTRAGTALLVGVTTMMTTHLLNMKHAGRYVTAERLDTCR